MSSIEAGLTAARVREIALQAGFDAAGIARIEPSEHAAFYRAWLDHGMHADMHYLARPDAVEARLDPATRFRELRSALVVAMHYAPESDGAESDPSRGVIARYARGRDYHRVMKKRLLGVLATIEKELGRELPAARAYVDTGPVLERELARRAGLGWFGRNTMLIHPRRGSWFFLGSLLLELDLEPDAPFEREHCGTCNACVEACPTGALLGRDATGAPVIDARLCISYLTIENRGPIPRELRAKIGNRVFGCDVCGEVCPWNRVDGDGDGEGERVHGDGYGEGAVRGSSRSRRRRGLPVISDFRVEGWEAPSLVALMRMTFDEWDAWTRGKALRRAGYAGFRRNVAVALGNWGDEAAVPVLVAALGVADPLVRGHAAWALGRIGSASSVAALEKALSAETDRGVTVEIRDAMAVASSISVEERGLPAR